MLSGPGDNELTRSTSYSHSDLLPLQPNFPDHITQLLSSVQNTSIGLATKTESDERARTGLAFAMDLIRMPSTEKPELSASVLSAVNRAATPGCSPPVASTPGTYTRQPSGFNVSPTGYTDLDSTGVVRADAANDTAPPPKKLTSDDIPVLDSFPGYYGFDLYRPLCGDAYEASDTKPSTAFFFFKDENGWTNLYSKKTPTWWTLSYWCQRQPPEGSFIRLTPVYGTADKQQEVIQRCFEDFMSTRTSGMSRYSIVLVGNSLADYFFDPVTERLCVTLPYERPKEGCEYSQFNGKFMCFNSCLYNGGQGNKKPLFLIITLERLVAGTDPSKGQCEVLGRQCIKFRSCACPKRDKENSERRFGEMSIYQTASTFGKRKKDGDRSERNGKKPRSHSIDFSSSTSKAIRHLSGQWGSPSIDLFGNHTAACNNLEDGNANTLFGVSGAGQTVVNYNGRSYHLLLVPTGMPGGIETLSGVRFGLIRTWLYTPTNNDIDKKDERGDSDCQTVIKQELDTEKKGTHLSGDSEDAYRSFGDGRSTVEFAVQQLLAAEVELAHALRDRVLHTQGQYHNSGDSTDSQPNSTGPVTLGLGSLDESVNPGQEFPQVCAVGPLSSDSGISTDPGHHHHHAQSQGQRNSLGFAQQSHMISDMFSATPTGHRSSGMSGITIHNSTTNCNMDYSTRFNIHANNNFYPSHPSGENPTELRNSLSYAYPSELIETYALVQQASAPSTESIVGHSQLSNKAQSLSARAPSGRQNLSLNTTVPESVATALSVNLNHALSSSAFYPAHYFGARQNTTSDAASNLLDSFSRTQLAASASAAQTNLCFHPSMGNGALAESLLLPEELLSNYLERDKAYEGTDGVSHATMGRHPYGRSPSCSSSSPMSPNSACCDKVFIQDM